MVNAESFWDTHDFRVKMLDWSGTHGSRLAYSCRRCERHFSRFAKASQPTWATDGQGRALESGVTSKWLGEACPLRADLHDNEDRKRLREPLS